LVGTTRNLASFASGAARVLVATDIAAPGHPRGRHPPGHPRRSAGRAQGLPAQVRPHPRVGAAGVVIKVQTSAQAADVRALMGRAGVVPLATRVSPGSALLAAPRAASETALTARPATGRGAVAMSVGYRGRRRR
jgi:superfamily II DNA/RNA helicase